MNFLASLFELTSPFVSVIDLLLVIPLQCAAGEPLDVMLRDRLCPDLNCMEHEQEVNLPILARGHIHTCIVAIPNRTGHGRIR